MLTHIFDLNFQEKKCFILIHFLIYLYLDTCLLYYKGILAFIFEHTDIVIAF